MSRTLYIGDIHGCADELKQIIDAFGFVAGKDTLYQTGDIINKGPDMLRAMELILKLGIKTVRGNHEEHLIRMMETPEILWTKKQQKRFERLSLDEWKYIRDIVKTWPLWRDTPHALLVHAGIEPKKSTLEEMDEKVLLSVRYWNGRPWFEQVNWPKKIVFGHWAKMGLVVNEKYIGLDSGCVYGKKLSAWCPEEDKFYSIPASRIYSPVKTKEQTAQEAPCKIYSDENAVEQKSKSALEKACPDVAKEWAGY